MVVDSTTRARRLGVHTTSASSKLVRDLTESLRNGNSAEVIALGALFKPVGQDNTEDVDALLRTLRDSVTVPCRKNRNAALQAATKVLRNLPPHALATHALPLARALKSIPCTASVALALASITAAIAPLRHTGGALVAGVVDAALSRLDDAPLYSALTLALASLAAAPSLVRPRINAIREILWNRGLHAPCIETRRIAALLAVRLVAANSQKTRSAAFAACIAPTVSGLSQIIEILRRYTYRPPPDRPMEDKVLHELDEDAIPTRFHSLCRVLVNLLQSPVAVSVTIPISAIIDTLTSALVITDVDALAAPKHAPSLAPDRVLAILPQIHATVLQTIPEILTAVHAPAISLPLARSVVKSLTDSLLDFANPENAPLSEALAGMDIRLRLYNAIAAVARLSSSSGLEMARALAVALNADISVLCRLRKVRRSALAPAAADGAALGGTARKRRRAQAGGATVDAALKLSNSAAADVVGQGAYSSVEKTALAGADAAGAILAGGALADTRGRTALKAIETALAKLSAIGTLEHLVAPLLVGGSGASRGRACPLLSNSLIGVPRAGRAGKSSTNATAAIDAILHPRASPVVRMPAASQNTSGSVLSTSLRFRSKPVITPLPTPMAMTTAVMDTTPPSTSTSTATETPSAMEIELVSAAASTAMQDKPENEPSPKKKVRFTDELVSGPASTPKDDSNSVTNSKEPAGNGTEIVPDADKSTVDTTKESEKSIANEDSVEKENGPETIPANESVTKETEKASEVPATDAEPADKETKEVPSEVAERIKESNEVKNTPDESELGDERDILNSLRFEASDDEQ